MITKTPTSQRASWILTYDAQQFGNSDVIAAAPSTLVSLIATNKGNSVLYLQLFDATAVPAGGTVPTVAPIALAAGATVRLQLNDVSGFGFNGFESSNGWCWAASTTAGTLTLDTTSSVWVTARYLA
jgi:hypothetical protein